MEQAQQGGETRTLYIQRANQNNKAAWHKLVIPATAKVTFGPLTPGNPDRFGNGGLYLRIYKTKDHQLAVIPNVLQFRDAELEYLDPTTKGFEPVGEKELLGKMVEAELRDEN